MYEKLRLTGQLGDCCLEMSGVRGLRKVEAVELGNRKQMEELEFGD